MSKVTIQDICLKAKASRTAVSRALNNRPGVNKATRERILRVIGRLKYTPSAMARNLRQSRTETIGVIFPRFEGAFFSEFLSGIEAVTQSQRYNILTATTAGDHVAIEASLEATLRLIDERRVDGIILFDPARHSKQERQLRKHLTPFVLAFRQASPTNINSVTVDHFQGAYDATKHLIEHGYKRIATLTGLPVTEDAQERLRGYQTALKDHFLPLDPKLVVEGSFVREPSLQAFLRHFQKIPWPEAVFAANDDMALGLLQYARNNDDPAVRATAIVGFDDIDLAHYAGLTTIHADVRRVGSRCAELLLEAIRHKDRKGAPIRREIIPTKLIVRSSCGCLSSPGKNPVRGCARPDPGALST
jgi:LacI family transcriptional regulator, galactose operon repressor